MLNSEKSFFKVWQSELLIGIELIGICFFDAARFMAQARRGSPYYSAQVLLCLGDKVRAIEHLQRVVQEYPPIALRLKVDPVWDGLRADPRFTTLLQKPTLQR